MVSRSEIDMKQIKEEYKKNYGKTLYMDILVSHDNDKTNHSLKHNHSLFYGMYLFYFFLQDDTKGDYEKILLALCGDDS